MGEEAKEIWSAPTTPRTRNSLMEETPIVASQPVSCPPSHLHSPSLPRSSLFQSENGDAPHPKTPRTPRMSLTPRNGNIYYAAFHTLSSGIGIQALVLPVAFTFLGWTWGIVSLTIAYIWQLYTLWLLVHLHQSVNNGEKLGKLLALFPILSQSAGTCTTLIIIGGSAAKTFYQVVCGDSCTSKPMTTVEWYLVFTCAAVVLSQIPILNSIAGISLIGAVTAVGYCTSIWVASVTQGALPGVSYNPLKVGNSVENTFSVLNALGIIAFAFGCHSLILEIQAAMPSSERHPSHVPMWKGVKASYTLIAACIFPLAIGGYWAYGQLIPANGGMLTALYQFHSRGVSRFVLGLTSFLVVVNSLCSFQIHGMPAFNDIESVYTKRMKKSCPWWLRSIFRIIFGFVCFFIGVAIPFLSSLAGLIGGVALPETLAYPCFKWLKIKKPKKYSLMWYLNWFLGTFGIALSVILIAASIYVIIDTGIKEIVRKDASVNFLTDPQEGRSTLRPTDILVYDWIWGKHVCLDLTRVFPLVGLRTRPFTVVQTALKAASSKISKHRRHILIINTFLYHSHLTHLDFYHQMLFISYKEFKCC